MKHACDRRAQVMGGEEGASSDLRQGCGLGGNLDVAVCRAEWLFHQGAYQARRRSGLSGRPCAMSSTPAMYITYRFSIL